MNRSHLWTAGLAVAALVVHFAVPFVHFVHEAPDGATTEQTHWPWELTGRGFDEVFGSSMVFLWIGLGVLLLGAVANLFADLRRPTWFEPTTAGTALLGVALVIHGQGLWLGRAMSSLANLVLGTDAPSQKHVGGSFAADYYTLVWPMSAILVFGLAIVIGWRILAQLAATVPDLDQADRHQRIGRWTMVAWAFLLIAPLSWQVLDDGTPAVQSGDDLVQDTDPFVWSMYDVSRIALDTGVAADEVGEPGLQEYTELAWLGRLTSTFLFAGLVASGAGLVGARVSVEDKLTGRTSQYLAAGVGGAVAVASIALIFLAAWAWYLPSDRLEAERTWIPLLAIVPCLVALGAAIGAIRALGVGSDSLLADDFPEPIIYD